MNIATIGTTVATASSQTLTIGSGLSAAATVGSLFIIQLGKSIYINHIDHPKDCWATFHKVAGVALMIFGATMGLASSAITGALAIVGLSTLGTATLGPIGTTIGVIAGVTLGVSSATVVITFIATRIKEIKNSSDLRHLASETRIAHADEYVSDNEDVSDYDVNYETS